MSTILAGTSLVNQIGHYIIRGLYWILYAFIRICDQIIYLVRALAGLESYWYDGSLVNPEEAGQGEVVINFLQEQGLINIFVALFVLSIVLLFIVTLVAVIQSEWSPVGESKGNNKYAVISKSVRALINLITVPVVSILGIIVGNELLKAVDGATHGGDNEAGMGNLIMQSITENATWAHINDSDAQKIIDINKDTVTIDSVQYQGIYSIFSATTSTGVDAAQITRYFVQKVKVRADDEKTPSNNIRVSTEGIPWLGDGVAERINEKIAAGEAYFSFGDADMVALFYKMSNFNYIMGFIVTFLVTKFLFEITFGLVKRIYMLSILILVSPPIVAVSPLQPEALKSWRKQFISYVLSIYGAIVGCNLFFILIPYVRRIQLFSPTSILSPLNGFVTLFAMGAGAIALSDFAKLITDIIGPGGGSDLHAQSVDKNGKSLWGKVGEDTGLRKLTAATLSAPTRIASDAIRFGQDVHHNGGGKAGWKAALGNVRKDAVKGVQGAALNATKKSKFLQELTGARFDKEGKLKEGTMGSNLWHGMREETAEAKKASESTGGGIGETKSQIDSEINETKAKLDVITQHQNRRRELDQRFIRTTEEDEEYMELAEKADEEKAEQAKLESDLKKLEADSSALDAVKFVRKKRDPNGGTYQLKNKLKTSGMTREEKRKALDDANRDIERAKQVIVKRQAVKQAIEDANRQEEQAGDSDDSGDGE